MVHLPLRDVATLTLKDDPVFLRPDLESVLDVLASFAHAQQAERSSPRPTAGPSSHKVTGCKSFEKRTGLQYPYKKITRRPVLDRQRKIKPDWGGETPTAARLIPRTLIKSRESSEHTDLKNDAVKQMCPIQRKLFTPSGNLSYLPGSQTLWGASTHSHSSHCHTQALKPAIDCPATYTVLRTTDPEPQSNDVYAPSSLQHRLHSRVSASSSKKN